VIFTPDPEKASQGHNVSEARQALRQAGELIKATPLVQGSSIRFAFIVASLHPLRPEDFPSMEWISLNPAAGSAAVDHETVPAPAPGRAPEAQAGVFRGIPSGASVRVDLERLDELMRLVSDLVVTRYRLRELLPTLQGAPPAALESLEGTLSRMERSLRELRGEVVRTRMVPLGEVFGLMPMVVRDLARASGKEIHLMMEGEATRVDKLLVERLLDPLLHLVRNAISHGIEPPAERAAIGKPAQGQLLLSASPEGDHIRITVSDDGRGIDAEAVATRAADLGWLGSERALLAGKNAQREQAGPDGQAAEAYKGLSEYELLELISQPGLTTRAEADLVAGRGVGMDVVRQAVEAVGGSLSLKTSSGKGSEFILRLPLTLTIVDVLIASCGSERYAIPRSAVDRVIEIDPARIVRVENGELYHDREDTLSLLRLAVLFQLPNGHSGSFLSGLISVEGERRTVLVVDRLIGLREVVVRPIADPLVARPGIAGATELGDGRAILILDLKALLHTKW
jgi:two-component system chemotaxis sensor kinase CheA